MKEQKDTRIERPINSTFQQLSRALERNHMRKHCWIGYIEKLQRNIRWNKNSEKLNYRLIDFLTK